MVRIHGPIALLRSVVFRVLGDKMSPLFYSCLPSSYNSSSSSKPKFSTAAPSSSSKKTWEARRDLYLSTGGQGSYLILVSIGVCAVVLIGEQEQEVVLTLSFLREGTILGLWEVLISLLTFMMITTFLRSH